MADIPQNSFTSGELSPALHGRPDLSRYVSGLETCRNMFVHPEGGVSNRPGFEFVTEVKDSNVKVRVVEFVFNELDTYCLEVGPGYIRFIRNGGQVLLSGSSQWVTSMNYRAGENVYVAGSPGVYYTCLLDHVSSASNEPGVGVDWTTYWYRLTGAIVEVPTPYAEADLPDLKYTQSADVVTFVHRKHPPYELKRYAHDQWSMQKVNFGPSIDPPTNLTVTGGNGTATFDYVVTAVSADTGEESLPSNSANGLEDLGVLTWNAVTGAESYNVYKNKNGVYGYIGNAIGTTFTDEKIIPALDDTPPVTKLPFDAGGDFPSAVTYHQQRMVFGGTDNNPQKIWLSQVANFHNFNVSRPQKPGDAITLTMDASEVNEVRNLVSMNALLVLTSGSENAITSGERGFSIENIQVKPQGYRGSSTLRPVTIGNTVLYIQSFGSAVRTLGYQLEIDGYSGNEISITARHLFVGHQWKDVAFTKEPDSIMWLLRDDGLLVGLTFVLEQEVIGWHRHDTAGEFEAIAAVPENGEDVLYAVVNRTIGGVTKRYIERKRSRQFSRVEDAFFVDSGLSYSGAPVTTLSGLDHLEGETVSILADGNVHPQKVVTGGSITLDYEASTIHVGLPYSAEIKTLEPPVQEVQGRWKRASQIIIGVLNTRGMLVGTMPDEMTELKQRENEAWGDPIALKSGYFRIMVEPTYDKGNIYVKQVDPLPLTILSIIPDYEVEG